MWQYTEGQCYGIVSVEVTYQEAVILCNTLFNSTLAKLPLNISDMDSIEQFYSDKVNRYWISGKCKFGSI